MLRKFSFLIIALAILFAAEPLLHSHPLNGGASDSGVASGATCAVCAAGVNQLVHAAPVIAAPAVAVHAVFTSPVTTFHSGITPTLPSRAPPAA